jgi:uncharacterized protein DUF2828
MSNKLLQSMRASQNYTRTENAALTHKSTLNDILDFYYHAPARRGQDNTRLFTNAFATDPILALKVLFYIRDIRDGGRVGERETFRQGLRWLYNNRRDIFDAVITLVPTYGRWDDVLEFVDSPVVQAMVVTQFAEDVDSLQRNKGVSLLAKWMPSANTSSRKTRTLARKWITALGTNERDYRSFLSMLRKAIGIVERMMSSGNFSEIKYENVPSKAATLYRKAFSKRDGTRYVKYLEDVKAGKTTIKAATLYPYELVSNYLHGYSLDQTLEAQWAALPNYVDNDTNALVMADVSGSMSGRPMEVSVSLAIYFAERNKGQFKDYFMTFSGSPSLERVIGNTLKEKVNNVSNADWGGNTNLQAAFDLILSTAVRNKVPADEMPAMLFIISDMEFDVATGSVSYYNRQPNTTNFKAIANKYRAAGYQMPKLVFWNVSSRNNQTPVTEKEEGVYLVSGSSAGVFKAALEAKTTTPYDMMLETLNTPRYAPIEEAVIR